MDNKIYEKLNDIKDLEDRKLLKKIMNNVFSALEDYTEEKLKVLEKRVFDEIEYKKDKYTVYSTIIKKEEIDPTNEFLYPILEEDMEDTIYETKDILSNIKENKPYKLSKVFLKCDYATFSNFINSDLNIKGIIETNKKSHKVNFKVKKNNEYLKKVEDIYKSFINNNITWTTINNPYINKIVDLILTECEDDIEQDENIIKISADFGELDKYVKYDMVPVWNLKELELESDGFPKYCEDRINYEHVILTKKDGVQSGYLVNSNNENIKYITIKKENIVVTTNIKEPVVWNLYKFMPYDKNIQKIYEYRIMSNEINNNFSNKFSFERRHTIKTKTELSRIINSFEISKYVKFKYVKLEENNHNLFKETYNANSFIIDEIREENIKKILILYFEPVDKEDYLNKDIISFLVSEIQFIYPEYECEGRLL